MTEDEDDGEDDDWERVSMHPYLFDIPLPWGGHFHVASYGMMIALGFLTCLFLLGRRSRRMGLDPTAMFDAAVYALIGGIVGARVFFVVDNWSEFADAPIRMIRLDLGGLTFYGGLIGGATCLLFTVWYRRLPLLRTLDVGASLVPLGHAFGRVGCFLNGCCYGRTTESWLGVRFPRVVDAGGKVIGSPPYVEQLMDGRIPPTARWSLPVHPTQLYEVAYELAFFFILSYILTRRRRDGDVAWLYAALYGCGRFTNEFFRADHAPLAWAGGLTSFQVMSLGLVVFGLVMLIRSRLRPPQPMPEPFEEPAQQTAG
jgi:phosphatidylglycerol:prolipoprotein diacylglycerol transferase